MSVEGSKQGKLSRQFDQIKELVSKLTREEREELLKIYLGDDLLSDVAPNPTSQYVDNLIKVETGQAFPVYVVKFTGEKIEIIVSKESRVKDLKKALEEAVEAKENDRKISWKKGVWRNYCLVHNAMRLLNPEATMNDYGINKNAEIYFAKYRESKKKRNWGD